MPIYDYKCSECEIIKRDKFVHKHDKVIKCDQCKGKMMKLVPTSIGKSWEVNGHSGLYMEHVSPTGKTFYSKREMRKFEKETGMILDCLH